MKIKEKKYNFFKNIGSKLLKILINRKMKILLIFVIVVAMLLTGTLFGLGVSGFFGTLDEPSELTVDFLHLFGINSLREIKINVKNVLAENVKIPLNYIVGKIFPTEKIHIDIDFKNYKKLEYKRSEAIRDGIISSSGEDYVPVKITHNGVVYDAKLRLKGNWLDHVEGDKWSLKINMKDGSTLFGMNKFSILSPERRNFLNEFVYLKALEKENVLAVKYDFIEVVINGKNRGIYALEGGFDKELVERSGRREGVILRFNDDFAWEDLKIMEYSSDKEEGWFYNGYVESLDDNVFDDLTLLAQFEKSSALIESFRKGDIKTSEAFDIDSLAKYYAVTTIFEGHHAATFGNMGIYYNPITSKLEPIGFDAEIGKVGYMGMSNYVSTCLEIQNANCDEKSGFFELFFSDEIFYQKYIYELERMSKTEYLDSFFNEIDDEIDKNIKILYKDFPTYHFFKEDFYGYQANIRNTLNPHTGVTAFFQEEDKKTIKLSIGNLQIMPIEIIKVIYNNSVSLELNQEKNFLQRKSKGNVKYENFEFRVPEYLNWDNKSKNYLSVNYKVFGKDKIFNQEVIPHSFDDSINLENDFVRQASNISNSELINIDYLTNKIIMHSGEHNISNTMIVPEDFSLVVECGVIINLINNSFILSYSDVQLLGTKEQQVKITSTDKTGGGIVVLNANETSVIKNVVFSYLSFPGVDGWGISSAVTFYRSPVLIYNSEFLDIDAEDSLNIVDTDFEIKNSKFKRSSSDSLDVDFGNGVVENTKFIECGNDCLDFSGSDVIVKYVDAINAGDKGISVGEKTVLVGENINIDNAYIGIASKDMSNVVIDTGKITNTNYSLAVYQKKSVFGPSLIEIKNVILNDNYIFEEDSSLIIDERTVFSEEENIYKKLYPSTK